MADVAIDSRGEADVYSQGRNDEGFTSTEAGSISSARSRWRRQAGCGSSITPGTSATNSSWAFGNPRARLSLECEPWSAEQRPGLASHHHLVLSADGYCRVNWPALRRRCARDSPLGDGNARRLYARRARRDQVLNRTDRETGSRGRPAVPSSQHRRTVVLSERRSRAPRCALRPSAPRLGHPTPR